MSMVVNGDKIKIMSSTLEYNAGEGGVKVRAATVGDRLESVHSYDVEAAVSKITVDIPVTPGVDRLINEWKTNIGRNVVSISQRCPDGGPPDTRVFTNMSASEVVDRKTGPDGTATICFEGDQMFLS
jgi:hypothetical protein